MVENGRRHQRSRSEHTSLGGDVVERRDIREALLDDLNEVAEGKVAFHPRKFWQQNYDKDNAK